MFTAVLLAPFALMQAAVAPVEVSPRFAQCVAAIDADAVVAYEEAMAWAADTRALDAYRCAAMALAAQGRYDEAAVRFESIAVTISPEYASGRAELLSQAGNAWLLAREPAQARSNFTLAIATMERYPEALPDLLIDRARAYAMEGQYRLAEEDLSRALDLRNADPLALRLRASARMHQNSFDLAEADALAAVALAPTDVDALLMLGHTREAKRTGVAVEEQ